MDPLTDDGGGAAAETHKFRESVSAFVCTVYAMGTFDMKIFYILCTPLRDILNKTSSE